MTKCPHDPYAYYDDWGNRYLVLSTRDYEMATRWAELSYLLWAR